MEQILITASASSVYSLPASPPPCAPVRHLTCSALISSADMSIWYALYCWLRDSYHILAQMGSRRPTGVFCRTVHTSLLLPSCSDSVCHVGKFASEAVLRLYYSSETDEAFSSTYYIFYCEVLRIHNQRVVTSTCVLILWQLDEMLELAVERRKHSCVLLVVNSCWVAHDTKHTDALQRSTCWQLLQARWIKLNCSRERR